MFRVVAPKIFCAKTCELLNRTTPAELETLALCADRRDSNEELLKVVTAPSIFVLQIDHGWIAAMYVYLHIRSTLYIYTPVYRRYIMHM